MLELHWVKDSRRYDDNILSIGVTGIELIIISSISSIVGYDVFAAVKTKHNTNRQEEVMIPLT